MPKAFARFAVAVGLVIAVAAQVEARVVALIVENVQPLANGASYGDAGPYERLTGTIRLEVDPRDPLNAVIVNLNRAPKNAKGMVEFSAPFVIIKPKDISRGNQKILYGINNRGNNIELPFQSMPPALGGGWEAHDGLFYRLGYTFVDAGWAGDIVTTATRIGAILPVAAQPDGRPIVAPIRIEYTGSGYSLPLKGNALFQSYETADRDNSKSTLTVRDAVGGARTRIAPDRWAFGRCLKGRESLEPNTTDLCLFDGFQANRIYELAYRATKPWVMGLGYAVTRDFAAFLRFATSDDGGRSNPLARDRQTNGIRRVYGLGTSSTGMYMRDFLYLGFNEDESHRKVFDAVRLLIPGTHRLFANVEFADPNVYSRQDQHSDFLSHSIPPLTYAVTTDPISGVRDGILKRPATDPLVFHVDSANEFWQMNASLNVHDGRGRPVPTPENVRFYFAAAHSHVGASGVAAMPTATGTCRYPTNGNLSYSPLLRALVVALDDWADRGIAPPPSRYPSLADGTLVSVADAGRMFPKIPGVIFPAVMNELTSFQFGPRFRPTGGSVAGHAPKRGEKYQGLVPALDADGMDLGGIKTVDVAAPIGTNTGWNLRAAGPRSADLCGLSGSFFPFAKTRAERLASGDPRPSLEERYTDNAGFVTAAERAARALVTDRFLLEEDAQALIAIASASNVLK